MPTYSCQFTNPRTLGDGGNCVSATGIKLLQTLSAEYPELCCQSAFNSMSVG